MMNICHNFDRKKKMKYCMFGQTARFQVTPPPPQQIIRLTNSLQTILCTVSPSVKGKKKIYILVNCFRFFSSCLIRRYNCTVVFQLSREYKQLTIQSICSDLVTCAKTFPFSGQSISFSVSCPCGTLRCLSVLMPEGTMLKRFPFPSFLRLLHFIHPLLLSLSNVPLYRWDVDDVDKRILHLLGFF